MTQVEPYPPPVREPHRGYGTARLASRSTPELDPAGAGPDADRPAPPRRGSHASALGVGLPWVLTWTMIGAALPGSGLIAAGRRRTGAGLLFLLALGGAALGGTALLGQPVKRIVSLAVDPRQLLLLTLAVGALAALWAAVIVVTNGQLRRHATLTRPQRAFSWLVVLALVAGIALPAYEVGRYALIQRDLVNSVFTSSEQSRSSTGPSATTADPWAAQPRENVLLIGSDAGAGRTGIRPDTLILASINTRTGDTVLFSLPRNLERVPFPLGTGGNQAWPDGYYCPKVGTGHTCLLNAIWTWAASEGRQYYPNSRNPGLDATEDAVQGITGLQVNTYTMLNLKGFAQFVNAIGGLRVNVDQRLPIGGNVESPIATGGYIEKGRNQLLDGYQALWFARSRWSTNDYDRMRRQRCVIGAVVQQADPLTLATAFPKIALAAKNNLSTGIPKGDLPAWVELAQRIQGATVRSLPFTDQVITDRARPDYEAIHRLVTDALEPPASTAPAPSSSASATGSGSSSGSGSTKIDPRTAQDVAAVC